MPTFTLTMPKLSPTMEAGTIAKWHVKEGDSVDAGQLLMEVSTDKATVEFNALDPGYIRKIVIKEGQEAKVNDTLAIMTEEKDEPVEEKKEAPKAMLSTEPPKNEAASPVERTESIPTQPEAPKEVPLTPMGRPFASPLARSLAKERGIDLARIRGSGPRGRIMSRDLEGAAEIPSQIVEESLSPIRKVIASRLQQAKRDIPHFYVQQAIDATALVSIREQLKEQGVTVNDLMVRGAALALKQHPEINSGFDRAKNVILRFPSVDISIAVDIPGGLITPIIFQADKKSLLELSKEIKVLVKKARDGKLQPHEFQGGSFSVSNLGMFGINSFSAVINPPQGAIIAIGGYQERLKRLNGEIVPYQEIVLTFSVDHRVIDGATAARFLKTLKSLLESPALLLV